VDAVGDDGLFDTWFPATRTYESFVREMQRFDPTACSVVLAEGKIIGHVDLRIMDDGRGLLTNIYLLPEWRGKGLGAQVDAFAVGFFKKHAVQEMALRTNPKNAKLVDYYTRQGWVLGPAASFGMVWMGKVVR
jgi:GNAT superfamily N-acetyltransferase